jgi:putative phage-type endonuclease
MQQLDMEQGSPEWFRARCGKVTASRVADIIAKTKTGYSTSRANYAAQLITERLTGLPAESFTNAAMQWGTDMEPEARQAYEFYEAVTVEQVGLVLHPTIGDSAASPDGLVGDDGLVEIKAPNTATHIETLLGRSVPGKYVTQMQWQMACTGRKWCDFVSYDPRMPESMRFFCQRVKRDEAVIADLEAEVVVFLKEVREKIASLQNIYSPRPTDDAGALLMAG